LSGSEAGFFHNSEGVLEASLEEEGSVVCREGCPDGLVLLEVLEDTGEIFWRGGRNSFKACVWVGWGR